MDMVDWFVLLEGFDLKINVMNIRVPWIAISWYYLLINIIPLVFPPNFLGSFFCNYYLFNM